MNNQDTIFLKHQTGPVHNLSRALQQDRVAHAYLFTGTPGSGKSTLARFFAQRLLCPHHQTSPEIKGCGQCHVCKRVWQHTHPDLHWVTSQSLQATGTSNSKKTASSELKIAEIRSLCQDLIPTPFEGVARVAVIVDAHQMTPQAANALLKTLEEPRKSTHLILIAPSKDLIMATLRSRLQVIRFAPLSTELVEEVLLSEGLQPEQAMNRSLQSEGSVSQGRQLAILSPDETQFLMDILSGSRARRVQKVSEIEKDRQYFNHLLEGLIQILSQEIHKEQALGWIQNQHRHHLTNLIEATLSAQKRVSRHGNVQLVAEKLFLNDFPVFDGS